MTSQVKKRPFRPGDLYLWGHWVAARHPL